MKDHRFETSWVLFGSKRKPPQVHHVPPTGAYLYGYPRKTGCFSARPLPDGEVDVAIYPDHTFDEVIAIWSRGEVVDAIHCTVKAYMGWGHPIVDKLRRELETA